MAGVCSYDEMTSTDPDGHVVIVTRQAAEGDPGGMLPGGDRYVRFAGELARAVGQDSPRAFSSWQPAAEVVA